MRRIYWIILVLLLCARAHGQDVYINLGTRPQVINTTPTQQSLYFYPVPSPGGMYAMYHAQFREERLAWRRQIMAVRIAQKEAARYRNRHRLGGGYNEE